MIRGVAKISHVLLFVKMQRGRGKNCKKCFVAPWILHPGTDVFVPPYP